MNSAASACGMPSAFASPKADCPYRIPKFTALATRRIAEVTSAGDTPQTAAAVRAWMSSPAAKACCIDSSPDRWARIRSSIWE